MPVPPSPLASALASCLQVFPQVCRLCSLPRASLKTSVAVGEALRQARFRSLKGMISWTMCDVEMYVREKCVMYVREKWSAGLAGLLGNCCSGYYL